MLPGVNGQRVIVCGAGAIGTAMGGYLAAAGYDVVLLGRPDHMEAIRRDGLAVEAAGGRVGAAVGVAVDPEEVDWTSGDLIFLTCKTQHTRELLQRLSAAPRSCPVFCFQNGVRNEEWAARSFPHVYGGVVNFSARLAAPGVVERTRSNELVLGRYPEGLDAQAEGLSGMLSAGGFAASLDPQVMAWKWGKLVLNLTNAFMALVDTWVEHAYTDEAHRRFMAETMREGWAVLRARGIEARMGPDGDMDAFIESLSKGGDRHPALQGGPGTRRTYPSTWQDLTRGGTDTEVPYFNGEIVSLGREVGIPTPYNATLLERMEDVVAQGAGPGAWSLEELTREVRRRPA